MKDTWFFYGIYMLWRWLHRHDIDSGDIEIVIRVKSAHAQARLESGICMEANPCNAYPIDGLRVLHGELFRPGFVSKFMNMGLRFEKVWDEHGERRRRMMRVVDYD